MSDTQKPQLLSAEDVDALLSSDDRATTDVYVPEWKRTVRLRQLNAADSILIGDAPKNMGLLLIVAMSCIDANGNRLFPDPERLRGKSAGALNLLQTEALKLNGFTGVPAAAKNG